jgi:energy-coupling factor transporter ATP-binding protein EcfA2
VLRQLTIKWFRGIRDGFFEGFGPVNLLVGPNGCGKSSFLEAICLLAGRYADQDPLGRRYNNLVRERRNERDSAYPLTWWHQFDQQQDIYIEAGIEEGIPEPVIQRVSAQYSEKGDIDGLAPRASTVQLLVRTLLMDVDSVRDQAIEETLWPEFYRPTPTGQAPDQGIERDI